MFEELWEVLEELWEVFEELWEVFEEFREGIREIRDNVHTSHNKSVECDDEKHLTLYMGMYMMQMTKMRAWRTKGAKGMRVSKDGEGDEG